MEFSKEIDYKTLLKELEKTANGNTYVNLTSIGNSILGRQIPLVILGDASARKSVLYVSTHHATENLCTSLLLKFIKEYVEGYERGALICGINIRYLFKMRKIYIVPMLNPDGVEYRLNGVDDNNPIKDRVIAYNEGEDFANWNANARGVDLNHNYNAYFDEYKDIERTNGITAGKTKFSGEYPESEPETSALASLIRIKQDEIKGIITLHTQGEEIYYRSMKKIVENTEIIARHVSRMSRYPLCEADGTASYGGLTDWAIKELNIPSYTLECGKGKNPLDIKQSKSIYLRLRELLFTFPVLF